MSVMLVDTQAKSKVNASIRLEEALAELSKDTLTMIRKNAAIKNVSKLNRDQLKAAIVEQLPQALAKELPTITILFDEERVKRLAEAVSSGGVVVIHDEISEQEIRYWQQFGLLFYKEIDEQQLFLMPTELVEIVKQHLLEIDMKLIQHNQSLIETVKGMIYYYGCLTHSQLEEFVSRYDDAKNIEASIMHLVIHYRHYKSDYYLNEQYIFHTSIPDPSYIVREQEKRDSLSFASFTAEELKIAAQPNYIVRDQAHRLLVERLVSQLSLQKQDAILVADQCEFGIRAGLQLNDLIHYIKHQLSIHNEEELNKVMPSIILLCNQTAQWLLKGHSATNLTKGNKNLSNSKATATDSKSIVIGRNDPCYCGSGKKYKKCCISK